jgi:hypothetical protein
MRIPDFTMFPADKYIFVVNDEIEFEVDGTIKGLLKRWSWAPVLTIGLRCQRRALSRSVPQRLVIPSTAAR